MNPGTLAGLESYHLLNLGGLGPALKMTGWSLFLYANLYSLDQQIKIYCHAKELGGKLGHRNQVSAVLGMMNSIGYILATVFSLFKGTFAIAIALGVLAAFAGALKFFYDFSVGSAGSCEKINKFKMLRENRKL